MIRRPSAVVLAQLLGALPFAIEPDPPERKPRKVKPTRAQRRAAGAKKRAGR